MDRFDFDKQALKRPTQVLAAVICAAALLVWYSHTLRLAHEQRLSQARSELNSIRSEYRLALEAGDIISTSRQRYRQLQQRGFVGEEPRLLWIESLRSAGQRKHLYNLQYTLKQQLSLQLAGLENGEHYQLFASPMEIQMELAHEVDLLRFFGELDREKAAVYELRGCSLLPMFSGGQVGDGEGQCHGKLRTRLVYGKATLGPGRRGASTMNTAKYLLLLGLLVSTRLAADYDPYGLLLTSPDQRARLDKRFAGNGTEASGPAGTGTASAHAAVVQPLRLNGTLISSVGRKQVWINGRGQIATRVNQAARVRLLGSDKVEVKAAASGATHTLKPGQILDPSTGQVSEAFEQASRP